MDADSEADDVVLAAIALRLSKTIQKKKHRERRLRWHGIEHVLSGMGIFIILFPRRIRGIYNTCIRRGNGASG